MLTIECYEQLIKLNLITGKGSTKTMTHSQNELKSPFWGRGKPANVFLGPLLLSSGM